MKTLVQLCLETSRRIKDGRGYLTILAKATEEMGELAQEALIETGQHYKPPGNDGVVGEALDTLVCCIDMINKKCPNITEEELIPLLISKLGKWETEFEKRLTGG